ncbi:MAG: hypothetical protein AMXMBFR64_01890 [Myxococcales bacterium]
MSILDPRGLLGLLVLLAAVAGCRKEAAPTSATLPEKPPSLPVTPPVGTEGEHEPGSEEAAVAAEKMLASHAAKREIMVGGCREDCGDPQTAFTNYVQAIAKRDGGRSSIPYLESSLMVHDGQRHGDEWVALWREARIDERRESIRSFARETAAWIDRVASPDDLEKSLATLEVELRGETALVHFRHPPLTGADETAPVWRFTLYKRGWEWLVSEIVTR